MMDRLETMACKPECVVGGRMARENTLRLRCRLETTHLAFLLRDVLARHLSPAVSGLPGSMSSQRAEFLAGGRIPSQLVRNQLSWRPHAPSRTCGKSAWRFSRTGGA